jgi:hypothetical protein
MHEGCVVWEEEVGVDRMGEMEGGWQIGRWGTGWTGK